ncbi:MAG: DUF3883 domain-containing protein [Phormidesmis sp. RL_2_1]|nr:DUF3883 domain-containing protein [Phormidesmis sp. RL_2_1]
MTTHLLSKRVEVSGVLEDQDTESSVYKRFRLQLDRGASTPDDMIAKVDKSYEVFEALDDGVLCPELLDYEPCKDFDTSFKYDLNAQGLGIANVGINDLYNALSYALIFLPKIKSVMVIDEIESTYAKYAIALEQEVSSGLKISTIQIDKGTGTGSVKIASVSDSRQTMTLAVPLKEESHKLSIAAFHPETPKLFCDFPLVGSEQFSFPVIFNSPLFNPSEPRDTVLLDERDDEKRQFNKAIFEECLELYSNLLNYASKHWQDTYLLASSAVPERVDRAWYKSSIQQPLRKKILETPVVDTCQQERIPLTQARIPYHRSSTQVVELWRLAMALHSTSLPTEAHVLGWYEIIDADWENDFSIKLRYTLNDLVQDIAKEGCLSQLAERLEKPESETLDWLNQVIAFAQSDSAAKSSKLLDTYPIIPNQYGNFQALSRLSQDLNIPEAIKYVLKILSEDWKQQLSHLDIKCQFSTSLNIEKASSVLDSKIRKNAHRDLRKAVYYLVSCYPAQEALSQDSFQFRSRVWQFSKDLDNAVPEPQYLSDWTPCLWDECDTWLLKTLVRDLARIGSLQNLQATLNYPTEDAAASWISDFIGFLSQNSAWRLFYVEEKVLPNQRGQFLSKEYLSFDKGIPDEIKDVLEKIDVDYRSELLDERIQGFESHSRKLGVRNASDEIDRQLIKDASLDNPKLKAAIFSLVSYFTEEEDAVRRKIWELERTFYGDSVVTDVQIVLGLDEFNWTHCNLWAMQQLASEVAAKKSIEQLSQHLSIVQDETIQYLDKLIPFACKQGAASFVESLKIWPNQYGNFYEKKALKKDGGIDLELKEICNYLTQQDWRTLLLLSHERFENTANLFNGRDMEKPDAIALVIDDALKEYKGDRQSRNFVAALKLLFEWSKLRPDKELKALLPYFQKHKAQIFLDIFGDQGMNSCIFDLMQAPPEKLEALMKLANSTDISQADIRQFVEHHADLKTLAELRVKRAEANSGSDVLSLLEELGFKPDYLDELLRERSSRLESDAVANLGHGVRHSCGRRVRTYPQVISFKDNYDSVDVGLKGEAFVNSRLVAEFGSDRVQWMNENGEGRNPYDFRVLEENLEDVACYIDAKSSRKGEHSDGSIFFSITNAQWDFLKECNNYYIAKVFRAASELPNLQLIKIDLRDELL